MAGIVLSTLYVLEEYDGKFPITLAKEHLKFLRVTLSPRNFLGIGKMAEFSWKNTHLTSPQKKSNEEKLCSQQTHYLGSRMKTAQYWLRSVESKETAPSKWKNSG